MRIARLMPRKNERSDKWSYRETYGLVDKDGRIATRDDITFATGVPIPRDVAEFLFGGWYDKTRQKEIPYNSHVSDYELLAPLPNPGKIVCLTFNYTDHAREQGLDAPEDPVLFIKPKTALTGTGAEIRCPDFVRQLDYEVELAVVVGNGAGGGRCKNVAAEEALEYVFGYMILNDVSGPRHTVPGQAVYQGKGV